MNYYLVPLLILVIYGIIRFRDVWLRYEPGSPLVLRGISLTITPGERVGIVGRSGCGKSSLIAALFLLNRPEKGQILVDGVDVCSIGLHQLRYSLCIIPQDPVLFSGTWRTNLDPFLRLSDEQLWASLELVGLKPLIPNLEEAITEDSLSMGQKQLICLCRVLVKRPKILVLDEGEEMLSSPRNHLACRSDRLCSTCNVYGPAGDRVLGQDLLLFLRNLQFATAS